MTSFLRLLAEEDKWAGLSTACARLRQGETDPRRFESVCTLPAIPVVEFRRW